MLVIESICVFLELKDLEVQSRFVSKSIFAPLEHRLMYEQVRLSALSYYRIAICND